MNRLFLTFLFVAAGAEAQTSGVYMYFPQDPANYSSQIQTDSAAALAASPAIGIVVILPANTVDCGNASTGPSICTSAMTTFDNDLKLIVGNPPNGYKIGIIFAPANGGAGAGGNNVNTTPAYVFSTAWSGNVLCVGCSSGAPLDVAYCNNYQGTAANGFLNSAVGSAVWNVGTYPTGGGGTWDHSGAPLVWEAPWEQWYEQLIPLLISWYKNTSIWKNQMGYFRWGISNAGSSVVPCPNVMSGTFSTQTCPGGAGCPQIALTRTMFQNAHNAIYSVVKANASGFVHAGSGFFGGVTLGNGDGSTALNWADDGASEAVTYGLGIGTQSLAGNATNGDQIEYAQSSACSNDWCNIFNTYAPSANGKAAFTYLQTTSPSNPGCLLQPASCNGGNLTGSLLTVLPFASQRHNQLFEIAYLDILMGYSANGCTDNPSNCGSVSTPYAPYQTAIQNAQNGVPSFTAVTVGKSVPVGKSVIQ